MSLEVVLDMRALPENGHESSTPVTPELFKQINFVGFIEVNSPENNPVYTLRSEEGTLPFPEGSYSVHPSRLDLLKLQGRRIKMIAYERPGSLGGEAITRKIVAVEELPPLVPSPQDIQ